MQNGAWVKENRKIIISEKRKTQENEKEGQATNEEVKTNKFPGTLDYDISITMTYAASPPMTVTK